MDVHVYGHTRVNCNTRVHRVPVPVTPSHGKVYLYSSTNTCSTCVQYCLGYDCFVPVPVRQYLYGHTLHAPVPVWPYCNIAIQYGIYMCTYTCIHTCTRLLRSMVIFLTYFYLLMNPRLIHCMVLYCNTGIMVLYSESPISWGNCPGKSNANSTPALRQSESYSRRLVLPFSSVFCLLL